jgi:hypothetical protein
VQLENALQDLIEAGDTSNADKALAARTAITKVISAYQAKLN